MKKHINVEITEMFMSKSDNKHFYYGSIRRVGDESGNLTLFGKILVKDQINNELIISNVSGTQHTPISLQNELGKNLDELTKFIVHGDLAIAILTQKNFLQN